eukprot:7969612-Lingulodinium_polyedra.AAC.1
MRKVVEPQSRRRARGRREEGAREGDQVEAKLQSSCQRRPGAVVRRELQQQRTTDAEAWRRIDVVAQNRCAS